MGEERAPTDPQYQFRSANRKSSGEGSIEGGDVGGMTIHSGVVHSIRCDRVGFIRRISHRAHRHPYRGPELKGQYVLQVGFLNQVRTRKLRIDGARVEGALERGGAPAGRSAILAKAVRKTV